MSIKHFIQKEVFLPRLMKAGVLVIYDPERRYRELCLEMNDEKHVVVDASESSIESREWALAVLQELGQPNTTIEGMLVYVPARKPLTDEDRQNDPFALYGVIGGVFPEGDGDEFQNLCLKANADQSTEIRQIFNNNPNPDFKVIDAVGDRTGWPNLRTNLQVESARDILYALLIPNKKQKTYLKSNDTWVSEAKMLLESTLGLKLKTRSKNWSPIADELWRFLLFSEFAFDFPGELPESLANIPRAVNEARYLVEDLCDRLRDSTAYKQLYIEQAENIEFELVLEDSCQGVNNLGVRDTFPFEERKYFTQAVEAFRHDNIDLLRQMLECHTTSIWSGRGENQAQWHLLQAAVDLVDSCIISKREVYEHSQNLEALVDYYLLSMREVDRLQREFEQAERDLLIKDDDLGEVVRYARLAYRKIIDHVQELFIQNVERSGWPPTGQLANVDVFDKLIAPKLEESGRKIAVLLIDALRYELGVELKKQFVGSNIKVDLLSAFAQLPTITLVGMASLLPGAGSDLKIMCKDDQIVVMLGDQVLPQVNNRMDILRKRYGDRFAEMNLSEFIRDKIKLNNTVELFVLRSNTIDQHLESTPDMALPMIYESLKVVRVAVHKLRELGFEETFILTDHGFYLNTFTEAGNVCAKPSGNWINIHERFLLGDGSKDSFNFVLPTTFLSIRGDFNQAAGPRAMVPYRSGERYLHGGVSLQEAIVPVISIHLQSTQQRTNRLPNVSLQYKRGGRKITTRLPVVEVHVAEDDLFTQESAIELLLEAHDKSGNVVGGAKLGGPVNQASGTVTIKLGQIIEVTLKMDLEFEGKFTVKALDPETLTTYSKLELETDYMV